MDIQKLLRLLSAFGAMCLLTGCELKLEVFLYNNTDTAITVGPAYSDQQLTVAPHASANVNKYWEMNPAIKQRGRTYRYFYPGSALPPGYTDGNGFKLIRRFEFNQDHRVYILPNAMLPGSTPPPQPTDFPLEPQ